MKQITDEEIREAAEQYRKCDNWYDQSELSKIYRAGARWMEKQLTGEERNTKPMAMIVYNVDQERKAIELLIADGYKLNDSFRDIDDFISINRWEYPYKIFVDKAGNIDAIPKR